MKLKDRIIKLLGGHATPTCSLNAKTLTVEWDLDSDELIDDPDYVKHARVKAEDNILEQVRPYIKANIHRGYKCSFVTAHVTVLVEDLQ